MTHPDGDLPPRLSAIVDGFAFLEGEDKLQLLLDYAERLPDLPPWLEARRGEMETVHECMTPVHVFAERVGQGLAFHFDVPRESPTVRGYASLLREGLDGAAPDAVRAVPLDFYERTGLHRVLSPQRLNGIHAILAHMQRLADAAEPAPEA